MSLRLRKFFKVCVGILLVSFAAISGMNAVRSSDEESEKKPDFVRLFINQEGSYYGGVITRTLAADQSVWIDASQSGEIKVDIYQTDQDALFRALSYKKKEKEDNSSRKMIDSIPFSVDRSGMHRLTATQTFSQDNTDDRVHVTFPIKKPGIYYARALQGDVVGDAFFVVSNIATQVKEADQDLLAWTVDARTGRHITEGIVETYSLSKDYTKTHEAIMGQDGVARVPFVSDDDILLVRSGEEITMTPLNFTDHSDRWFVGDWSSFDPTKTITRSFLFTDRPLYQPGDTVLFKSILRDDHDAVYGVSDGAVKVKLYKDGYWNEQNKVFEQTVKLSKEGTLDGDFHLPATIETGNYMVTVGAVNDLGNKTWEIRESAVYGAAWFEVQYYRKPEYGINVDIEEDQLISGDTLHATVSGSYFSGQPLEGETLNYVVRASNYYDSPYDNQGDSGSFDKDYRFGSWGGREITSGTITLDTDGKAVIDANTILSNKDNSNWNGRFGSDDTKPKIYSVEVSMGSDGQHAVFANRNVLVMPGEFSIRQKDYIQNVKQGRELSIPVILRNNLSSSSNLSNRNLEVSTHMERWIRNEDWDENNREYQPRYFKEEQDFDAMYISTDQNGEAVIKFTPPLDGSYNFSIKTHDDRGNDLIRTIYVWVSDQSGEYYRGSESNQSRILTLQVDDRIYRPGDSIDVSISSLVPNREVWLTFERDHVRRYQSVFVDGNSTVVKLALEENDIPDIFLSGTVFDVTNMSTDQAEININTESKEMRVDVQTDKDRYEPGDMVSVEVSAKDYQDQPVSGEVTLWAVDKALFDLVDPISSDIFKTFWFHRYHSTQDANSLQGLTYTISAAEKGGCFSGDTMVLMEDGSSRAIRDVRVGDRVLTRKSDEDETLVLASVLSTHEIQEEGYLLVNGMIKVTPTHKLFVNGIWKPAGDMVIGDRMTGPDGSDVLLQSMEWKRERMMVYNLTIDGTHSFFADGILAHNDIGGKGDGIRSKFVDTAYWNPQVKLGSDGKAKVTFKLPDNTTAWMISAVGADQLTRVGQAKREIVVSKDVIVRTVLPNEMRVGDTVMVTSMIHNNTDQSLDFDVSSSFSAGSIDNDSTQVVSINAHDSRELVFKTRPERADEGAIFTVKALPRTIGNSGISGDTLVLKVPVVEYGFALDTFKTVIEPTTFPIHWNNADDISKRRVTLDISSDLFGTLPSAMRYLLKYPYGCVEQTTSRLVPLIIARQHPQEFSESLANVNSSEMISVGIRNLYGLQNSDGSFGFWHEGEGNPFITAYVAEYVVESKKFDIEADMTDSMLKKIQRYVESESESVKSKLASGEKDLTRQGITSRYYEGDMISLAYAKSILGLKTDASETHPGDKLTGYEHLPPDILALAVLTNVKQGDFDADSNGARVLLSMAQEDDAGAMSWRRSEWTGYYASNEASTSLAARALIAVKFDQETIAKIIKTLNVNRDANYWGNTFATVQVIRALTDFHFLGQENVVPDYTYRVLVGGQEVASGAMKGMHGKKSIELDSKYFPDQDTSIQIIREGTGDIYTSLSQNAFLTDKKFEGVSNHLIVRRTYQNMREFGAPIAIGDRVNVIIDIDISKASFFNSDRLVVDDVLPSGLIPVNDSFKNEQVAGKSILDRYNSYSYFHPDQYKRNGVILTANMWHNERQSGHYRATYMARAVNAGEYAIPPVSVAFMYAPEYSGYSPADSMVITEEKLNGPALGDQMTKNPEKGPSVLVSVLVTGLVVLILSIVSIAYRRYRLSMVKKEDDSL